jgi:hypothetical protein
MNLSVVSNFLGSLQETVPCHVGNAEGNSETAKEIKQEKIHDRFTKEI